MSIFIPVHSQWAAMDCMAHRPASPGSNDAKRCSCNPALVEWKWHQGRCRSWWAGQMHCRNPVTYTTWFVSTSLLALRNIGNIVTETWSRHWQEDTELFQMMRESVRQVLLGLDHPSQDNMKHSSWRCLEGAFLQLKAPSWWIKTWLILAQLGSA